MSSSPCTDSAAGVPAGDHISANGPPGVPSSLCLEWSTGLSVCGWWFRAPHCQHLGPATGDLLAAGKAWHQGRNFNTSFRLRLLLLHISNASSLQVLKPAVILSTPVSQGDDTPFLNACLCLALHGFECNSYRLNIAGHSTGLGQDAPSACSYITTSKRGNMYSLPYTQKCQASYAR